MMGKKTVLLGLIVSTGLLPCFLSRSSSAEESGERSEDVEAARSREATENAKAAVRRYELASSGEGAIKLHEQPLLKWSNPAAGSIHGNVFIWTRDGRPFVAGSLFQWFSPFTHQSHEFVSLATTPLAARYQGTEVWRTAEPGVEFTPLTRGPKPASSPARRLVQMRALLRQFSATKIDREGQQQELRPLTQPVLRYQPEQSAVVDGGLFVFVQGTDPEVWLMLEAHQRDGHRAWHFAAAPMNSVAFRLHRNGRQVWHVDIRSWSEVQSHAETYTSFRFGELKRSR